MTTYRDALAEIETLRQEAKEADRKLAISEAACASAMAEVEALRDELRAAKENLSILEGVRARRDERITYLTGEVAFWKEQRDLAANVAAGIADLDEVAPALRKVITTERARRKSAEHDNDRLRYAAQHAVDLYRMGNVMGTVVAVDRLGEVLDGGT